MAQKLEARYLALEKELFTWEIVQKLQFIERFTGGLEMLYPTVDISTPKFPDDANDGEQTFDQFYDWMNNDTDHEVIAEINAYLKHDTKFITLIPAFLTDLVEISTNVTPETLTRLTIYFLYIMGFEVLNSTDVYGSIFHMFRDYFDFSNDLYDNTKLFLDTLVFTIHKIANKKLKSFAKGFDRFSSDDDDNLDGNSD